jgi:hypothetical protein
MAPTSGPQMVQKMTSITSDKTINIEKQLRNCNLDFGSSLEEWFNIRANAAVMML